MTIEKRRSRTIITLITPVDPDQDNTLMKATFEAAKKIERGEPRPGSFHDLEQYERFAETLRGAVASAIIYRTLPQIDLELPGPESVSREIARVMNPIPGLSLVMEFSEEGFKRRLVGRSVARPYRKHPRA